VAVYVYPEQFERCVALLTQRLQTMASRGGVADAQTGDPCMAFAASYVLNLAAEIWEGEPASIAALTGSLSQDSQGVR
jgi:hypothetical protein